LTVIFRSCGCHRPGAAGPGADGSAGCRSGRTGLLPGLRSTI